MITNKLIRILSILMGLFLIHFNLCAQNINDTSSNAVRGEMLEFIKGRNEFIFKNAEILDNEKIVLVKALNKYDKLRQKIWADSFQDTQRIESSSSESDYKDVLDKQILNMRKQADILQEFVDDLKGQLSYQRIYHIILLERQYAKKSLSKS